MEDKIEDIPKTMEKFFGCSGKMVKPSLVTVKTLLEKIPKGKIVTLDQLRGKIAQHFNVQTSCPAATVKMLQVLSIEDKSVCYWRVVKKKGELISKFPGGIESHGALLKGEGLEIDSSKKNSKVKNHEAHLSDLM